MPYWPFALLDGISGTQLGQHHLDPHVVGRVASAITSEYLVRRCESPPPPPRAGAHRHIHGARRGACSGAEPRLHRRAFREELMKAIWQRGEGARRTAVPEHVCKGARTEVVATDGLSHSRFASFKNPTFPALADQASERGWLGGGSGIVRGWDRLGVA